MNKENLIQNFRPNNLIYPAISLISFAASYKFLGFKIAMVLALFFMILPYFTTRKFLLLNLYLIGFNFLPDIVSIAGAFGILILYLVDIYIYKKESLNMNTFFVPVIFSLLMMIINTLTSLNVMGSIRDLAMNMAGIAILISINSAVNTKDDFNKILTSIAINAAFICIWGIIQYKFFGTVRREWVDADVSSQISARAYSVFMNPNVFAEYIVLVVPLVVSLFWTHKDGFKKFVFLGIALLLMLSLLLTFSRGGILSVGISAFTFLFFLYRPLIALFIPFGLLGMSFLPENIRNRIISITNVKDSSASYRFKIWQITKDVIKDNPISGVGFGHKPFKQTFERYIRSMPIFHAHNTYLEVMAEGGATGFITFLFVVIISLIETFRIIYNTTDKNIRAFACGLIASTVGILAHGMFEDIIYINRIILMIWIVLALTMALKNINKKTI